MRLRIELQRTGGNTTGFEMPDDVVAALGGGGRPKVVATPAARDFWQTVSYSNQRWHVEQLTSAKAAETRAKRLARSLDLLRAGKAR